MNHLLFIWPSLGSGRHSFPRNLSWTKSGPGRRHNKRSKAQMGALAKEALK